MKYDVLIIGAGTAGSMLATRTSQKGLKVALIDRKRREKIGDKICGDAIAKFHLSHTKKEVGFGYPEGEELKQSVSGLAIHPPNRKNVLRIHDYEQEGYVLDRLLFGQRLLNLALDSGAELMDEKFFDDFIIEGGKIQGAKISSKNKKETIEIKSDMVIEATGSTGVLRKRIPIELSGQIEKTIDPLEMGYAYRKIVDLKEPAVIEDTDYVHLYFIQEIARGGYAWVFPRGPKSANVGIGGPKLFTSGLKEKYVNFAQTIPELSGSKINAEGGGYVPIRRPMNSFVADNFALIGDSAYQVNPLHGGGIGANLEAGIMLGDVIVKAHEENNFSEKNLWDYNVKYCKQIGANHAALDIFKLVATSMSDKVFNITLNRGIITEEDIITAGMEGSMKMTFSDKLIKALKGYNILGSVLKLRVMSKKMNEVKNLYKNYPEEPEELESWKNSIENIYSDLRKPFKKFR